MKSKLKVWFTDFWDVFDKENNLFTTVLSKDFDVEISPNNPDILFYSWQGRAFEKYDCIRIYYTPENWLMPKYKECDFSLSFEHWDDARNLRLPNYLLYDVNPSTELDKSKWDIDKIIEEKEGFCSFVVSNPKTPWRNDFFHELSKYKRVDAGGKLFNNIGGPVSNKRAFLSKYKFNIAFENAQHPGYTTEKIVEAMVSKSIPIYRGDPLIQFEFNNKSFFNHADYNSTADLIEDIIEHDKDDSKYYQKFIQPWFEDNVPNQYFDLQRLRKFLFDIVQQKDTYTPIAQQKIKQKVLYPLAKHLNNIKSKLSL